MNRYLTKLMPRLSMLLAASMSVALVSGCDLDIENPNAPDAQRAFVDPSGL